MQVYHITDPTTAYTLKQLFAQQAPPPLPQTSPTPQLTSATSLDGSAHHTGSLSNAQLLKPMSIHHTSQTADHSVKQERCHDSLQQPLYSNLSASHLAGQVNHSLQQPDHANLSSPTHARLTSGQTHQPIQSHWQQQDLTDQAKAIAEQLRQELLESGKRAVYQLLMKNLREALPSIQQRAKEARQAAVAKEAAEAELLQAEAEAAAELAAEMAAAKKARERAEAEARAAAAEQ